MDGAGPSTDQVPLPPLKNPKYRHISRSAAKRESVQLLGSIKDLQLRFAQAGLEHRPGVGVGTRGLSSLGEQDEDDSRDHGGTGGMGGGVGYVLGEGEENQPPGLRPRAKERQPWKEVDMERVDRDVASREVRGLLEALRVSWDIWALSSSPSSAHIPSSPVRATENQSTRLGHAPDDRDTRPVLVQTAQAIRRVRKLALSVSASHHTLHSQRRASTPLLAPPRNLKPRSSISTPSRPAVPLPRAVAYGVPERRSSLGSLVPEQAPDDLAHLRKAALEVLTSLRILEEKLRLPPSAAADTLSPGYRPETSSPLEMQSTGSSAVAEPGLTAPMSQRPGSSLSASGYSEEIYSDDEDEYNLNVLAQEGADQHAETWEERIVSEDRQYRPLSDAEDKERHARDCVRRWMGAVERLFFGAESEIATADEEDEWVREEGWEGKPLLRAHACLVSYLPLSLQLQLPQPASPTFQTEFLCRLSDGYILAQAFNAGLDRSAKAWGYIADEDVHNTLAPGASVADAGGGATTPGDEPKREKEWTFRRVRNLTCWAAALRLRYQLPIHLPVQSTSALGPMPAPTKSAPPLAAPPASTSPALTATPVSTAPALTLDPAATGPASLAGAPSSMSTTSKVDVALKITFDPLVVAKRSDGWEGMLGEAVSQWVGEVAREAREARRSAAE